MQVQRRVKKPRRRRREREVQEEEREEMEEGKEEEESEDVDEESVVIHPGHALTPGQSYISYVHAEKVQM